jgi:hypothetical protein
MGYGCEFLHSAVRSRALGRIVRALARARLEGFALFGLLLRVLIPDEFVRRAHLSPTFLPLP